MPLIQKILRPNPKPGRNYSTEEVRRIIPDAIIEEKDEDLEIFFNLIVTYLITVSYRKEFLVRS